MRNAIAIAAVILITLVGGCRQPTAEQPDPTAATVMAPATVVTDDEPASTPTVAPIELELPTAEHPDMVALRAQAIASMGAAFEALDLPDIPAAAQVNGTEISMALFTEYLRLRLYAITMQNEIDWSTQEYQGFLPQIAGEVLDVLVQSEIVMAEANALGVTPSAEEIVSQRNSLLEQLKAAESVDTDSEVLQAYGVSLDTLSHLVSTTLAAQAIYDQQAALGEEEQVRASHILVATIEEAEAVTQRLEAGEEFATLAQELSIDTGSAAQEGDLGWFPRGAMVEPFEQAAFALEPGEISVPVESDYGFHIILLQEKAVRPLDPSWAQLRQQELFDQRLAELEGNADIERFILAD